MLFDQGFSNPNMWSIKMTANVELLTQCSHTYFLCEEANYLFNAIANV